MTDADLDTKMTLYSLAGQVVINSPVKGVIKMLRRLLLIFLDSLVLSLFALRNRLRNGSLIYVTGLEKPKNMRLLITGHLMIQRAINTVAVNFEKYVLVLLKSAKQQRLRTQLSVLLRNG